MTRFGGLPLVDPDALLVEEWQVLDLSRRNDNYALVGPDGTGCFVKRAAEPDARATVSREAAVLVALAARDRERPLPFAVPAVRLWDPEAGCLVTEYADRPAPAGDDALDPAQLHGIGRALAALHAEPMRSCAPEAQRAALPWVHTAHLPPLEMLNELTPAVLELVKFVQRSPVAGRALDDLFDGWTETAFVHGDFRWGNVLKPAAPGDRLVILDWELAGLGDPLWDVGSVVGAILDALPGAFVGAGGVAEGVDGVTGRVRQAAKAFLGAYGAARGAPVAGGDLMRALCFAGASLLQTAVELAQNENTAGPRSLVTAQLAVNVLERPETAAEHVLGLG